MSTPAGTRDFISTVVNHRNGHEPQSNRYGRWHGRPALSDRVPSRCIVALDAELERRLVVSQEDVAIGDVLYLHDNVTRLSRKDVMRWCIVTAVIGRNVRVAGRSTTRKDGVPVPATAMDAFDKDGWVPRPAVRISLTEAHNAHNIGSLPNHYLQQVLFYCNEEMP